MKKQSHTDRANTLRNQTPKLKTGMLAGSGAGQGGPVLNHNARIASTLLFAWGGR